MKSKKLTPKEEGYLLLESLFTLIILMTVVVVLCPLAVSWLSSHRSAKSLVEENRLLYESSIILNNEPPKQQTDENYSIEMDKYCIRIKETGTEVIIYESVFEKQ